MSFILLHHRLANCRRLYLRNYETFIKIGVLKKENSQNQRIIINVDLFVLLTHSTPKNDQLHEVVNYDLIKLSIEKCIEHDHIHLQETLCDSIATRLLLCESVLASRVSTEKPDAYPDCDAVGVEVFLIKDKGKQKYKKFSKKMC